MTGLQQIDLGDGRLLEAVVAGEGEHLLVYHHGTPAAGPIEAAIVEAAAEQGMRVAELVRPGYGASTREANLPASSITALSVSASTSAWRGIALRSSTAPRTSCMTNCMSRSGGV